VQIDMQKDGSFVVNGLGAGDYQLQAHSPDGESLATPVHLPEDGAVEDVVLTVRPRNLFVLEVSSDGGPVAGAAVLAIGVENTTAYATPFTTDGAGTATIDVPPGNEHVDVQ